MNPVTETLDCGTVLYSLKLNKLKKKANWCYVLGGKKKKKILPLEFAHLKVHT